MNPQEFSLHGSLAFEFVFRSTLVTLIFKFSNFIESPTLISVSLVLFFDEASNLQICLWSPSSNIRCPAESIFTRTPVVLIVAVSFFFKINFAPSVAVVSLKKQPNKPVRNIKDKIVFIFSLLFFLHRRNRFDGVFDSPLSGFLTFRFFNCPRVFFLMRVA